MIDYNQNVTYNNILVLSVFVYLFYISNVCNCIHKQYESNEVTSFITCEFQLIVYDISTRDSLWPVGTSVYDCTKQFTLLIPFMVQNYFVILTVAMGSLYNYINQDIETISQIINNLTTALSGYDT